MIMASDERARELVEKGKESLQHHHLSEAERLFLAALQCLPSDSTDQDNSQSNNSISNSSISNNSNINSSATATATTSSFSRSTGIRRTGNTTTTTTTTTKTSRTSFGRGRNNLNSNNSSSTTSTTTTNSWNNTLNKSSNNKNQMNTKSPAFEAYHGLAQTYSKKGRHCRSDEKEWHRYYLQSLCMYKHAIRLAPDETEAAQVKEEVLPVQKIYSQCLETRLFPPHPPRPHIREVPPFPKMNAQWLQQLTEHVQRKLTVASSVSETNTSDSISSDETISSQQEEIIQAQQKGLEEAERSKRSVDFNRVRKTIMRMVKQISTDMRSRYLRKRLSQDTLKQAVSSQMLCMLTPENEDLDVVSLFESYLIEEEPEFEVEAPEGTISTDTSDSSKQTSSSNESEYDEKVQPSDQVQHNVVTPLCSIREVHVIPRIYHQVQSPLYRNRDSSVQLNGILRIWRGDEDNSAKQHSPHVPYNLNFEECSPLTETAKYSFQDILENKQNSENVISEDKVNTTLASLLSNIADQFCIEEKFDPANELYTYALGVYQQYEAQVTPDQGLAIAHLLNSIGKLHCRRGDMIGGTHLMEKSVELYRQFHADEDHLDIISVWYELGRAFMYESYNDDSLFDHVMKTVRGRVDSTKTRVDEDEDDVDYASDSDESDAGSEESYLLNIHEAKGCFNQALRMLHNQRRHKHELHNSMYVDVLSKLADCCVILGDYNKATMCNEEALILFQNIVGSNLLHLNAHVLTMLGVTNYLLGNYPKAMNMLETSHILQQHMQEMEVTFTKAFTLTMLGITNHAAGQYYKCVAWCLNAHELYTVLFPDLSKLSPLKCWFIIQNVYMLGFAYSFLNLKERALHYLELSHDMVLSTQQDDVSHTAQVVHILKLIADVYQALEQPQKALEHYEKAQEYSVKLGEDQRSSSLHNQLLSCMAGLHITSKNYNTAAQCLEQALGYQENLQDTIKEDMFSMLHSLGITYTLSGDMDKAIGSYNEAVETYHEMHSDSPGPELANIIGHLATLYHVKMCLEEDEDQEKNLCEEAERHYKDACELDPTSPIVVQFANFQYHQSQTPDALLTMLTFLQGSVTPSSPDVLFNGPEQAVLPSHLQFDVDEVDEVVLNAKVFGLFLAVLSYKELGLLKDAEDSLVEMYKFVYQSSAALSFSMLGYALMEMDLLEEAAVEFSIAFRLEPETTNSLVNVWICLVMAVYKKLTKAMWNVFEFTSEEMSHSSSLDMTSSIASTPAQTTVEVESPAEETSDSKVLYQQHTSSYDASDLSPGRQFDQNSNVRSIQTRSVNFDPLLKGGAPIQQLGTSTQEQSSTTFQRHTVTRPTLFLPALAPMDISPEEVLSATDTWQEEEEEEEQEIEGPNAEILDEMLKHSEDIEAELQDCLRHIDVVNQNPPSSDAYDWRARMDASSGWRGGNDSRATTESSRATTESKKDSYTDRRSRMDATEYSSKKNTTDSPTTGSREPSQASTPISSAPSTPVSGWRAATTPRTQEILASIQNNNLSSKLRSPTVEQKPQDKLDTTTSVQNHNITSKKLSDHYSDNKLEYDHSGLRLSSHTEEESDQGIDVDDGDEEQWQVWEEEEVVETPPEILAAILRAQRGSV